MVVMIEQQYSVRFLVPRQPMLCIVDIATKKWVNKVANVPLR